MEGKLGEQFNWGMPVIIRGARVRFLTSGPGDGPKPIERPPCEYCGKPDHPFVKEWGRHISDSNRLREAMLGSPDSKVHEWYTGPWTVAAHHLIPGEALEEELWGTFCRRFGYDVDCAENGVMLPSSMEVACQLEVPVHRGPHTAGQGPEPDVNYPRAVRAKLKDVEAALMRGEFCANPGALVAEMNALSAFILSKVASFKWTITRDGRDYRAGGRGCAGASRIPRKPERECPEKRQHDVRHGATGKPLVRRGLRVGA
ncbi:AHH domain-containing protein (plasmid) [Myxococcus sp. MxC21-1]|uniref:AHH domain-containing protein n=1 Tax=Myxococcus sp. MxC21-1 TaxID=3041439 RepID=UPI002931C211|nr:AHH domain-containing protein [Myxococcus sp. MxC21-1]WNZ66211.1 AHH domain-containing protein [Myxococcus sp. MxC21-1]